MFNNPALDGTRPDLAEQAQEIFRRKMGLVMPPPALPVNAPNAAAPAPSLAPPSSAAPAIRPPSDNQQELTRLTAPPQPGAIERIGAGGESKGMMPNPLSHTKADTGLSGIGQIKHGAARVPLQILDAVGSMFVPSLMAGLPGTQLHHQMLVSNAAGNVNQEQNTANAEARRNVEAAQVQNLASETEARENPKPPAPQYSPLPTAGGISRFEHHSGTAEPLMVNGEQAQPPTRDTKTDIHEMYSEAVQDALKRGVKPAEDPKVQQLAQAIQDAGRPPAEKVPGRQDKAIALEQKRRMGQALTPEESAFIQAYEHDVKINKTDPQVARAEVFVQGKELPTIDTHNNNALVYVNPNDINKANRETPGRYVPAGAGGPALTKTALLEDIRGNVQQVRNTLSQMPDFDTMDKAKIAVALRSRDPKGSISALISGSAAGSMTPQQQEYLINVTNLIENAMAMRTVLGAGQGSEDLRSAIMATIPGPATPSKAYALQQLNTFEKVLDRLGRGVPKVPLRTDVNGGGEGAQGGGVRKYNPATGKLE